MTIQRATFHWVLITGDNFNWPEYGKLATKYPWVDGYTDIFYSAEVRNVDSSIRNRYRQLQVDPCPGDHVIVAVGRRR